MHHTVEIVSVDGSNVDSVGFFCRKSKMKTPGNRRKLEWLKKRFDEGLRLHLLYEDGRSVGYIEYIPAEAAWRPVHAPGYYLIHCLWVVGKAKGKGYGSLLVDLCLDDARESGKRGVAMVTTSRVWLAGSELLLTKGFEVVDTAPPSFELLAFALAPGAPPRFPTDWTERAQRFGAGLTVVRTDQCPYIDDAVNLVLGTADDLGIEARVVDLATANEARDRSPSPYGTFGIVHEGRLLSYHYLTKKDLQKNLGGTHDS